MKTQYLLIVILTALTACIGILKTANAGWEDRIELSGFGRAVYQITDGEPPGPDWFFPAREALQNP